MLSIPDRKIREAIEKEYHFRGLACVCLTRAEHRRKWENVLWRISRYGYGFELLETYRERIESRIAWIPEDAPEPVKKVKVEPKIVKAVAKPKKFFPKHDGYDMLRFRTPPKLRWRQCHEEEEKLPEVGKEERPVLDM
jgi:hypothetical protein